MGTGTSKKLKPIYNSITLAEGESLRIELDGATVEDTELIWSSSDNDNAVVDQQGTVTGKYPGEATITVKSKTDETVDAAKIKLFVVQSRSFVSEGTKTLMPLYIEDDVREKLLVDCGIASLQNILDYAKSNAQREKIAEAVGVNAATVGVWFRQAALWQINGMTREIAYLLAMSGVRNAHDMSLVDYEQLKNVIRIIANSIKLPQSESISVPSGEEISLVLKNAIKMKPEDSMYYAVVGGEDPDPSFLLRREAETLKTDSEILQEGLSFLNNIKLALPFPKTVSGTVILKDNGNKPKRGVKVSLTGIAKSVSDKTEGAVDLCCFTDENGHFAIEMPDRYNVQEIIKFSIIQNTPSEDADVIGRTLQEGAALCQRQADFLKRSSELTTNEFIEIATGKDGKTTRKSALDVLRSIDRITILNEDIISLENKLYEAATDHTKKTKDKLEEDKTAAEEKLRNCEYALKEELSFHYKEKENEIEKRKSELNDLKENKKTEFKKLIRESFENYVKAYNKYLELNGLTPISIEQILDGTITLKEILASKPKSESKEKPKKLYHDLEEALSDPARKPAASKEVSIQEPEIIREYLFIEGRIDTFVEHLTLNAIRDDGAFTVIPGRPSKLTVKIIIPGSLIDTLRKIQDIEKEIAVLEQERDLLGVDIDITDARYKEMENEHKISVRAQKSSVPFYERVRNACDFAQDKINDYFDAEAECLEIERQLDVIEEKEKIISRAQSIKDYCDSKKSKKTDAVKGYEDDDVASYMEKKQELEQLKESLYFLDETTNDFERTVRNFLSRKFEADFGVFEVYKDSFEIKDLKPRALPSVKLMGEGDNAVYLPTDTASSRTFKYSMLQRLVAPEVQKADSAYKRTKLPGAIDVMAFKKNMRDGQNQMVLASSLGIGYMLNMHQAWVPDGYTLGNLLYSLVLAPGEEQRIIIREHKESYHLDDKASSNSRITDNYTSGQVDNETAAFMNSADRFSKAHSDSQYTSKAKSGGFSLLNLLPSFLGGGSASTSKGSGSSSSDAYQSDSYDELSNAAQSFQSNIQSEAARIAMEQRSNISIASSEETNALSSKIIANHNHSHVMTVQYWEVMRRYCLETCIEGVDLVLFVPLKLIDFSPNLSAGSGRIDSPRGKNSFDKNVKELTKTEFSNRYGRLLEYADVLEDELPSRFKGGLNLIRQYSSYPNWITENKTTTSDRTIRLKITGRFMSFDNISATLYFNNGRMSLAGRITSFDYFGIHPSMNKRSEVLYAMKKIRGGSTVEKDNYYVGTNADVDVFKEKLITHDKEIVFEFDLPYDVSGNDISHIILENHLSDWQFQLSQNTLYMDASEVEAIAKFEDQKYNFAMDNEYNGSDIEKMAHYKQSLPEAYLNPIAKFSRYDLQSVGDISITGTVDIPLLQMTGVAADLSSSRLGTGRVMVDLSGHVPTLGNKEVMEMENTLEHVVADSLHYSQVVWESLSDDERVLLLEPYTIEIGDPQKIANAKGGYSNLKGTPIPLLDCVNAKKLLGFYGNCMLLPFTYPKELSDVLGKTAAEVQDELYRYHTSKFRVPTTVVSMPTDGMVGEAVLGATNVSEKIDLTRFWNWKDSEIDHMSISENGLTDKSILATAKTQSIIAPSQGATAPSHVDANKLLSALTGNNKDVFNDLSSIVDLRDLMKSADNNASQGRDKVIESTSQMVNSTIKAASDTIVGIANAAATAATGKPAAASTGGGNNTQQQGTSAKPQGESAKPQGESAKPKG